MISEKILFKDSGETNPYVSFDSTGKGLSRVLDDPWDFTSLSQNIKKVSFTAIPEKHKANVQTFLYKYLVFTMEENQGHFSVATIDRHKCNLSVLANRADISDLPKLSDDQIWRRTKECLSGIYTKSSFKNIVGLINSFGRAGIIDRHIKSDEFGASFYRSDAEPEQHIALPTSMHIKTLEKVCETVEKYHPWRSHISEVMGKGISFRNETYTQHCGSISAEVSQLERKMLNKRVETRARRLSREAGIPDFKFHLNGHWLANILKDCLICIALFSGARRKELMTMNPVGYSEINGIATIRGLTSKGNDGQPIYTTWNTHPIARKALELSFEASNYAREIHKAFIEQHYHINVISKDKYEASMSELSSSFIGLNMGREIYGAPRESYLQDIGDGLGVDRFGLAANAEDIEEFELLNPSRVGQLKLGCPPSKFSLHDCRRSFAVFMIRNRLGGLLTIKYQLKHKNLQMSGWYANYADLARTEDLLMDDELMSMCDAAMEDAAVDALDDIYNLSTELSGEEGLRISKAKMDKLEKGEQIYLTRNELRSMIRSGEKSIVMLPTGGYCTNPDCERLCSLSVVSKSKKGCGAVMTDRQAKRKLLEHDALVKSFRGMNDLNDYAYFKLLEGHKGKIKSIEELLIRHNIEFNKFNDEINVDHVSTEVEG